MGVGRTFIIVPASNAFIPDYGEQFPVGDNDGQARVFQTFAAANSALVTGRGDRVLVHPGAYTITANVAITKSHWTMEGIGPGGSAVITTSTADSLTITGDNWSIKNMGFVAATTLSCVVLTGCDSWAIEDCQFLSTVGGAGTYFIEMVTTANTLGSIKGCRFTANLDVSGGGVTMTGMILGLGNRIAIEHCSFDARRQTTANAGAVTAGITFGAAADWGNTVTFCRFVEHNGATFTAGIEYATNVTTGGVWPTYNTFLLATDTNAISPGSNAAGFSNNMASGTV